MKELFSGYINAAQTSIQTQSKPNGYYQKDGIDLKEFNLVVDDYVIPDSYGFSRNFF